MTSCLLSAGKEAVDVCRDVPGRRSKVKVDAEHVGVQKEQSASAETAETAVRPRVLSSRPHHSVYDHRTLSCTACTGAPYCTSA